MSWGAALGVVGSLLGGSEQSKSAAKSQEMAARAQQFATEAQRRMYEEGQAFLDPFRQAGYAGLAAYEASPQFELTPEEMYKLQEDQAALQRIYSAQGKRQSGEAARGQMGLVRQASTDAYNRAYGRMLEAAGIGTQAAQAGAQQALRTGQGIASAYMQGAQNQIPYINLQGQLNASNIAGLSSLVGSIANYYQSRPPQTIGGGGWGGQNYDVGAGGSQNLWGEEF